MENLVNKEQKKLYTITVMRVGTLIGGPLVGGYFIAENFKALKMPFHAKMAWIYTILFTILLIIVVMLLSQIMQDTRIIIPLLYTTVAQMVAEKFQGNYLKSHKELDGQFYKWQNTIVPIIIGALALFVILFFFLLFFEI